MNVFDFATKYRLSVSKARLIKKDFPQLFTETESKVDHLLATLSRANPLTAPQLVELIHSPAEILNLGRYAGQAEKEISALGDAKGEAAPLHIAAEIAEAARNNPEAVSALSEWVKSILPAKPVGHAYIAVRLLLGLPDNMRKSEGARIPRALLNVRQSPGFAGWWSTQKGVKRNRTVYRKFEPLDL